MSTVGSFYARWLNKVFIPAGILESPLYDINRPNYLNYGGIGTIIGHEMSHAFDKNGIHYDKRGNSYMHRLIDENHF